MLRTTMANAITHRFVYTVLCTLFVCLTALSGVHPSDESVRTEFEAHYNAWKKFVESPEMKVISNLDVYADHPEFVAIVQMGNKALSFVMEKIAEGDFLMNRAAQRITGINIWKGVKIDPTWRETRRVIGAQDTSKLWLEWWKANKHNPRWQGGSSKADDAVFALFTADTSGEIQPCHDCGRETLLGGLARRGTIVKRLRQEDSGLLLIDGGNALFGVDSMESKGSVMVAAYNALGYDAVNLSYRDFRLGKAATLALLKEAKVPLISANLLDDETGDLLAKPYVVKEIGGRRIVLIGVTQSPAGLGFLPHLKEQLAGIRIQSPTEALAYWVPKTKTEADRIILIYYGSAAGLEPIREKFAGEFAAILVGGSRPEYLPSKTTVPVVGTGERGQYLAQVKLVGTGTEMKSEVTQIPVELTIVPSEEIEKVLAKFKPEAAPLEATIVSNEREKKQPQTKEPPVEKEDQEKLAKVSESIVIGENLRVGMPIADAMALLGMPEGMRSSGTGAEHVQWMDYPKRGIAIGARPGGKTLEHIEVQSTFSGRLASGVQMGDHYTTVITKYGMPAAMTLEEARYPDQGLVFRLQDEKIVGVEVSLVAEVAKEAAKKVEEVALPAPEFTPAEASNKAVRVEISNIMFTAEIAEQQAPRNKTFLIIETRWENIHPKQKVDKDKTKGKRDPTMGVRGLGFGGGAKKAEYIEADVPYQIERLLDHADALADGLAFALHNTTDNIDGGVPRQQRFTIAKHGEVREAKLVFLIPKDAKNLAFQFFDYRFGHMTLPIQGDLELARSAKGLAKALAQGKTDLGEFIVTTVDFKDAYVGKSAPQGWHYAVVGMGGKSLSGAQNMRNIVQIDPFKNTWVSSQDACLYYCSQSSTVDKGTIRFTPEVYQYQELAFLVPASERTFDLGIRLQNDVTWLKMMKAKPKLPKTLATHKDGSVMEVMILGVRKADGKQVVDLAIQSLEARKGIQIQPSRKFILIAGQRETHLDQNATTTLFRRPPEPFIVPPETLVRFELAYDIPAEPTALRYQGFQSHKLVALKTAETPEDTSKPTVSKAPADTQTFGGHRYKAVAVPEGITWEEAKARAEAMGGYLAVITSDAENTFLHVMVVRNNSLWTISPNNNGLGPWLGGYQPVDASEPKGDWSWVNGETWGFTKWARKEPNNLHGNEDRLHFFGPGKPRGPYWNDIYHGTKLKGFIVEFDSTIEEKPPSATGRPEETSKPTVSKAPADTQTLEGHYYKAVAVSEGITWEEAKGRAEALGGYLAVITSATENDFVFNLAEDDDLWLTTDQYGNLGPWLGGYQPPQSPEPGGRWKWVNGEAWDYTNWVQEQPNNNYPGQDHLHFWSDGKTKGPQWNDIHHSTKLKGFIFEFDGPVEETPKPVSEETEATVHPGGISKPAVAKAPPDAHPFGGHHYKAVAVPEGITWEGAKARAEAMGGYLAVITNVEENDFVYKLTTTEDSLWYIGEFGNYRGPWLGGFQPPGSSEPKGGWTWVNGEAWRYANWARERPNDWGDADCLLFFAFGKRKGPYWNDAHHSTKLKGFIVEFDSPTKEKPKPVSEEPAPVTKKSNKCVELTVVDYTLKERIGDTEAGEGRVFVVVTTRWKNITQPREAPPWAHRSLKTAGQARPKEFIPVELRLSDDFYLLVGGKRLAPESSVANTLPNALPAGKSMLPKPGDQLEGVAAFLVRKDDLTSFLLVYFDKENGDIEIPIMVSGEGIPEQAQDLTEKEPNDNREQANLLRLDEPVEGLFQSKSDSDWYRLDLSGSGISLLRIDLSGVPNIDSELSLHNAKGGLLKRVNGLGWAKGEAIVNFGVAAGTYYVQAKACGGCLNTFEKYTLSAKRLGTWSEGQELEPNDIREQANLLRLGEPLEGLFQFKSDSDWYRLDVISSGTSLLRIDLSGVPGLSPQLSLHDADGELLKSTYSTKRGAAEALVNIAVTTGTYYVQARECCNWNTSDSYTIHAQLVGEWGEDQELEPNDKLEQANTIQLDDPVKGFLQNTKDKDWYRLEITEPGENVLQVDMSGTPGVNSFIALYDAAGKMLVDVDATGQGGPETLVQVGITQGIYYVVPYSLGGESPGRDETEGYTLTARVRSMLDQPAALVKEQTDLPSGYNIALADLGGKVERVTVDDSGNYMAAKNLNDGAPVYWRIGFMGKIECLSCGWSNKVCRWSSKGCQFPQELVFSFFKEREVLINAVVIDTRTKDTLNNPDLIPQHVEIWVSSSSPTENFTRVAGARLRKEAAEQLIRFPPSRGKYIQIRLLSNYGGRVTQVGEVKVFEDVDAKPSILWDFERNLALPELGGAMVRFTSQFSKRYSVGNLVDRSTDTAGWLSRNSYLPQDFVFSLRGDRLALVDRVVLDLDTESVPNTWPKTISVLISTEHPLDGFREVGRFTLNQQARRQSFPIGLRARFLKLRILENFGGKNTSLGEVKLIEGEAPGYQSILVDWPKQEAVDKAKVAGAEGEVPEHIPEREPNDALEQANLLEQDQFTGGAIDPLGERDCFHISRSSTGPSLLTLDLMGRPNIRAAVELLDEKGEKLRYFDPGSSPTDRTTFSWLVDQQDLWFRLTEAPVSIVLIWDTSGSMRGSTDNLRQALEAFVDQIRPDDRLNLIRFSDNVEVLLDKFTSDKAQLKAAIQDKVFAKGGTALYEALAEGIKVLEKVKGNRAIVLMTDGTDTVGELNHPAFWKLMEKKRVRTYAIGMGVHQEIYKHQLASWGKRILGHIALATNGRALLAPTKEQLKAQYQKISDELHKSSKYFLKPTFSRGPGFISVVSTGEKIAKILPPRLELVLDCSGSMRERKRKIDGKLKIDVAKEVMSDIIQNLPKEMEVALRVYGHRIREGRSGDCQDSQLIVPFGKLNKAKLLHQVQKIKALGTTPLAYSLEMAAGDFPKESGEKLIVLVTDGKEECGGEPEKVAQRLVREGLNVRVNVVGFALADENVKQDMRQVAEITGGYFFDAQNRQGLRASLQSALAVPFDVVDTNGVQVGSGLTGQGPIQVPEGLYSVIVRGAGEPIVVPDVRIISDQFCRVEVKKEGQEIGTRILGPMDREKALQIALGGPSVQRVVNLRKGDTLGIKVEDAAAGLRITAVEAGGAGKSAGLQVDDLITRIEGKPVRSQADFVAVINEVERGERNQVTMLVRSGMDVVLLTVRSKAAAPKPDETTAAEKQKKGADPRIRNAQRWLRQVGFDPGPADGLWGGSTARAVQKFQEWYPHQKLTVTGLLDDRTYAALQEAGLQGLKRVAKPKPAAKFCIQCGARLKPGARFCTQCGAKVAR